jgi:streptogramin lyase
VVVWDPTQPTKPVTTREEFICGHVVVLGDSAWAGCDKQVLRWDGRAFRSYLKNDANDATYYEPMLGKAGQLWVRYGAKTFAYEPQADRFKPVDTPWPGSPYDALVRKNGEVWWIDFLKSLDTTSRRYALKSQDYPGRDPRRLVEDATGTLWVEDFESGFFHLDAHSGQFVQEPGIESRASGVAFDLRHERLFLLHYRQGLTVTLNHRAVASIDLSALQYMRDLMLDQAGDVWVAGWTELVRLREQDGNWSRTSYRVR